MFVGFVLFLGLVMSCGFVSWTGLLLQDLDDWMRYRKIRKERKAM